VPTQLNIRYEEIESLWPGIESYQKLAEAYGIKDIFSDNGGKMLQLAIATGLDLSAQRMGPDGFDRMGGEYEIKTVDISGGNRGFSTSHHLNRDTIARYRARRWIFAIYDKITLIAVYRIEPAQMEQVFANWELALRLQDHLNNPKIPLQHVRQRGTVMYLKDVATAADAA
jgi:hypothetical protein